MYVHYNPNPDGLVVGDCVIRALSKIFPASWESIYADLAVLGLRMSDMPSANRVWGAYLKDRGWNRSELPNSCPDCYTVKDFCADHSTGAYVIGTGTHVIAVNDGNYYDAWDSGDEVPICYWRKYV